MVASGITQEKSYISLDSHKLHTSLIILKFIISSERIKFIFDYK